MYLVSVELMSLTFVKLLLCHNEKKYSISINRKILLSTSKSYFKPTTSKAGPKINFHVCLRPQLVVLSWTHFGIILFSCFPCVCMFFLFPYRIVLLLFSCFSCVCIFFLFPYRIVVVFIVVVFTSPMYVNLLESCMHAFQSSLSSSSSSHNLTSIFHASMG